jgi:hypothetical protein
MARAALLPVALLGTGSLAAGTASGTALAASTPGVQSFTPGRVMYDGVKANFARTDVSTSTSTIRHFTATVNVGATTYQYSIVGKNPAKPVTSASSTIKTFLVPLEINFGPAPYDWDPTVADSCDSGASALARAQHSPVFAKQAWTWGGTAIGTDQYIDAFQRSEFWQYAHPGGVNPTYNVNLSLTVLPKVTINVPSAGGPAAAAIKCGNGYLGAVNVYWLDPYLQSTVIPSLASQGVGPGNFPIFLVHNVVEYVGTPSACCVLGHHNAYGSASAPQTYALSLYDNSGAFAGSSDISALSHEVGEWVNDPFTTNPTPSWGHIGQVSGCQTNLEVGDPLSGTTLSDTVGGFTYHPQELAFFSWFYQQSTSLGVNGWYSNGGTFTTYAANCA